MAKQDQVRELAERLGTAQGLGQTNNVERLSRLLDKAEKAAEKAGKK